MDRLWLLLKISEAQHFLLFFNHIVYFNFQYGTEKIYIQEEINNSNEVLLPGLMVELLAHFLLFTKAPAQKGDFYIDSR
jgi:hypothetical protein